MAFHHYARYYDVFYQRKNYQKECDFLEKLFQKHCVTKPETILDLGCGTANHMIPLINRGYRVAGVDRSREMLLIAKQKLDRLGLQAQLFKNNLESFQFNGRFDAVIGMFSVIDYIVQMKKIVPLFKNIVSHMSKNAIVLFDFWNAEAVEGYFTPAKKRIFSFEGKTIERRSMTKIYPEKRMCQVNYICTLRQNGRPLKKFQEKHWLRYFSIEEMKILLQEAGLEVDGIYPFLNPEGNIRRNTWDVTVVAKLA